MGKKKGAPVVIVRKDKRLFKTGHLLAFAVTGGMSSAYTAAKAATNAGYNARTRKLQAQAEEAEEAAQQPARESPRHSDRPVSPPGHSERLADAAEKVARAALAKGTPRSSLGLAAQLAYDRLKAERAGD